MSSSSSSSCTRFTLTACLTCCKTARLRCKRVGWTIRARNSVRSNSSGRGIGRTLRYLYMVARSIRPSKPKTAVAAGMAVAAATAMVTPR